MQDFCADIDLTCKLCPSHDCLSFRYRLAPEHRFPSALNDCLSVSRELITNGMNYQINPERIILSGDSAGGNLALSVTQSLIQEGHKPYLLCLLYPSLQFFDFTLPSYRTYLKRNILGVLNEDNLVSMFSLLSDNDVHVTKDILFNSHTSSEDKRKLYSYIDPNKYLSIAHELIESPRRNESLIKNLKYLISPSMSPLLVPDQLLSLLPPVLLFTTEFDILRDEGTCRLSDVTHQRAIEIFRFIRIHLRCSATIIEERHLPPPLRQCVPRCSCFLVRSSELRHSSSHD